MGEFDAFFAADEPKGKKKKGGEFDAFFEEPAKPMRPGGAAPAADEPLQLEGRPRQGLKGDTFEGMRQNFNAGIQAMGQGIQHPIDTIKDPSRRREFERGLSDVVTLGLAEKAARAVDPERFGREQAATDAAAAPGFRAFGGMVATPLPSPAKLLAGRIARAVPGAGTLPGAARGAITYEATAPASAAIQAEPGHRAEAALDAATDPAGLILSSATGAAGGAVSNAPERVRARGLASVSRGEEGGTANARLAKKAAAKDLYGEIGNDLPLEAAVGVIGKTNPNQVAKMLTRRLDRLTTETEPIYKAIDDAPDPRFANAAKAPKNGGIDLDLVQKRLEAGRDAAKADGRAVVMEAYDKALARLRSQYGTDGVIIPGTKLPSRSVRNYANELGDGIFTGEVHPALRQKVKQQVYRDVVGAIEDEGRRVGVDVSKLTQLNKKISTFASVRDAYADRAARGAQGHTTLYNNLMSTAMVSGGMAHSGLTGALTAAAVDATRRAGLPVVRGLDFGLAKLVQASRAGAPAARLGQMAIEMGISREVAARIANGGLAGIAQPDDDEPYTVPTE